MIELDEQESTNALSEAMTPMIDVIFVLLAFMMLMINVPLLTMQVELPETVNSPDSYQLSQHTITIAMLPDDGSWYLGEDSFATQEALKQKLIQEKDHHKGALSVVINSDKSVPVERLVEIFSLLQSLNLSVTHLAIEGQENQQ